MLPCSTLLTISIFLKNILKELQSNKFFEYNNLSSYKMAIFLTNHVIHNKTMITTLAKGPDLVLVVL